jgi:hypothetical protein
VSSRQYCYMSTFKASNVILRRQTPNKPNKLLSLNFKTYNNTAEKTHRRRYFLIRSGYLTLIQYFLVIFSPSTCNIRHLTLDMLPSTFSSRHLTLNFLPSTFYPHPRLFTLTLDFLPSPSTFNPRHSTNR